MFFSSQNNQSRKLLRETLAELKSVIEKANNGNPIKFFLASHEPQLANKVQPAPK